MGSFSNRASCILLIFHLVLFPIACQDILTCVYTTLLFCSPAIGHGCAPFIPRFSEPKARLLPSNDRLLPSANNTLTLERISLFLKAIKSRIIMIFNRSWLNPVRSRFGAEYRYEGIREKADKRPSIFGRARVATLVSLLITIVIFLSLVVCLEINQVLTRPPCWSRS